MISITSFKKSFKIPNGLSEAVNQRRTDNAMANRKWTTGQTTIYKILHRKLKHRSCVQREIDQTLLVFHFLHFM